MNASTFFIIVHRALISCSLLILASCGEEEQASDKRTGSSDEGMLEEKKPVSDINGRISTLRERFEQLREPPKTLNKEKKERWEHKLHNVDSTLLRIQKRIESFSKEDSLNPEWIERTDRVLQRLGAIARSMERVTQRDNGKEDRN